MINVEKQLLSFTELMVQGSITGAVYEDIPFFSARIGY
jgi:hypothetical protein